MSASAVIAALQFALDILTRFGVGSPNIKSVIELLLGIVPAVIQNYKDVKPYVQNIIAVLSNSDDITPEQIELLERLEEQLDKNFDDALKAYMTNHPENG